MAYVSYKLVLSLLSPLISNLTLHCGLRHTLYWVIELLEVLEDLRGSGQVRPYA